MGQTDVDGLNSDVAQMEKQLWKTLMDPTVQDIMYNKDMFAPTVVDLFQEPEKLTGVLPTVSTQKVAKTQNVKPVLTSLVTVFAQIMLIIEQSNLLNITQKLIK